ncbi:MAG TPA: MAPEG family protein [Methyloceanibacter sp.]|nr:MAPEG family protein [Methyloceanibacter sp.]
MTVQAILLPMFVQVGLTFVLLFWMSALRLAAIRSGQVDPQKVRLREPNWPPRVTQVANAFHNQLELPMLFYVVVLLAFLTQTLDVVLLVLSWMFVLARLVHAYVHVTSNRLDRRTGVFGIGAIALFLMWVIVIARFLLQASS